MSIKAAKAANIQKQKLILMKVHSTIFNYDFFHNRCVIDEELASAIKDEEGLHSTIFSDEIFYNRWAMDEELASAIKDEEGLQIGTLKEFNLVIKKNFSMDNFVINGNIVITNVVRVDTNIFKRARVTFYYITDSTNKVKVPSGKSPI
eukprot:CAMPEP_0168309282 /NCGR_PEP_ID=MMETSP0142_2-20121227/66195_1 /TAXON_ID=44445 /ORGANISM="Pseudo-nitzschia australis, Strain 10249 10 AB" /LENGTH=147 /DNA_ID=CAMNT_0008261993 /DNA_START=169 /DNA_END=612 /DNA_ORIENTATION=-